MTTELPLSIFNMLRSLSIKLLNNPNKKFDGIDGNFYFKNNIIERDLNILKINNGNSFVIN